LHMAQLMPLPLTVSCFSEIQIGFTFLVPAHLGSPGKRAVKRPEKGPLNGCSSVVRVHTKVPSVLWHCWLGSRKGIRPVKKLSGGVLAWLSAELHIAQLMPLPLTVSASVKSRLVLPLWYWLTWVVTDKGPLNGCVCVRERESPYYWY